MDVGGEMIYRPKYFKAYELVDFHTFDKFGEDSVAFFRPEILIALDTIREKTTLKCTVNNWKQGGPFKWRGLRTVDSLTGASYSMHRFGGAFDLDIDGLTADEAREWLRANRPKYPELQAITRIEIGVNWCHIDCKPVATDKLVEFTP